MCSCARIGLPAATRPTSGSESCARLGSGSEYCLPRAWLQRAQCVRLQPDAARGAADQLDHALARQRLQVLLGGVGRLEAELVGDLGAGGRGAGALDRALHQVENLLLAVGEFRRSRSCASSGVARALGLSLGLNFIQCLYFHPVRQIMQSPMPPPSSSSAPAGRSPARAAAPDDNLGYVAGTRRRRRAGRRRAGARRRRRRDRAGRRSSTARTWTSPPGSGSRNARRAPRWRGPRWPASSSRTAPTRSRRRPTSCTACSPPPSRWC